jgi:hypothetical protein
MFSKHPIKLTTFVSSVGNLISIPYGAQVHPIIGCQLGTKWVLICIPNAANMYPAESSGGGCAACRGLTSELGQNNCFLNVIIQSLWHLRCFREALLRLQPGDIAKAGCAPQDARVLRALWNIFQAFSQVGGTALPLSALFGGLRFRVERASPEAGPPCACLQP